MKIKIIDLLNKIANGEEVPKKIKDGSFELTLNRDGKHYGGQTTTVLNSVFGMNRLNDEVEIIEEDKEIDFIEIYYDNDVEEYVAETFTNNNLYKEICNSKYDEMIIYKINELIKEVNELKKGK